MPDKIEKKEFMVEPEFNMPAKKSLESFLVGQNPGDYQQSFLAQPTHAH